MLPVVKKKRVEVSSSGSETAVDAFATDFWRQGTPGDLLRGYRPKHGFTQQQLAKMTGIGQTVISAYENNKRPLTQRAAIKIGRALGENQEKFFPHIPDRTATSQ